MNTTNDKLFEELIQASRVLVTVTKNAATVLSEEFEDMVIGPATTVETILDKCPEGGIAWDGRFDEADVDKSDSATEIANQNLVVLTHRPSGLSVEGNFRYDNMDMAYANLIGILRNRVEAYVHHQRKLGMMD